MLEKRKVLAYITRGNRLLVFSQPESPEAGIQVPGGSLEDGETPEAGALREATEETGLTQLKLGALLGETWRDLPHWTPPALHHRYVFHILCEQETPESWRHWELTPSDGSPGPIAFDFYWVDLPDGVPPLIGEMGALIPTLLEHLKQR